MMSGMPARPKPLLAGKKKYASYLFSMTVTLRFTLVSGVSAMPLIYSITGLCQVFFNKYFIGVNTRNHRQLVDKSKTKKDPHLAGLLLITIPVCRIECLL